jgi:hypothetical protein
MTRRLLNLLTVGSLLVCAAVVVLWVRSFFVSDYVQRLRAHEEYLDRFSENYRLATSHSLFLNRGRTELKYLTSKWYGDIDGVPAPGRVAWNHQTTAAANEGEVVSSVWNWLGFDYSVRRVIPRLEDSVSMAFPMWLPAALFAALPATRLCRRLRRRMPGCCASCGYDLRATPDRCPECGSPK